MNVGMLLLFWFASLAGGPRSIHSVPSPHPPRVSFEVFSMPDSAQQLSVQAQVSRIETLIRNCRNPRVKVTSIQAVQEGSDVVIRGGSTLR